MRLCFAAHILACFDSFHMILVYMRPVSARTWLAKPVEASPDFAKNAQDSRTPAASEPTDPGNPPRLLATSHITVTDMKHKLHHALCFASLCTAVYAPQFLTYPYPEVRLLQAFLLLPVVVSCITPLLALH